MAAVSVGPISGKTVVVVGGSRGIGAEFVRHFVAKGNKVIAACRQPAQAKELQVLANVQLTTVDISSPPSIEKWAAEVAALAPHVDVVINNAGVMPPRSGLEHVSAEDMSFAFQTNCVGPLLVVQQLHKRGVLGGKTPTLVATLTSKMGSIDDNGSGSYYAYRTSKAAVNIVNKSLSIDLAPHNVTCTLLHPGYVRTDMTGGAGLIDKDTSVAGMIAVLEGKQPLQGAWYDYSGKVVPW